MTSGRQLAAIARRRAQSRRIQALMLEAFEPASLRYAVRRSEVTEYVARRLREHPKDAQLVRRVTDAAISLGWRYVFPSGRSVFRGARRRGRSARASLAWSKRITVFPNGRSYAARAPR